MGRSAFDHGSLDPRRIVSLRLLPGLLLGGGCLYLAVRGVNLADMGRLLRQADGLFIGLALAGVLVNLLAKIVRWEILLGPAGLSIARLQIASAFLAAQLLNAVLPLRMGEIGRVAWLGRPDKDGPSSSSYALVAGSVALEKVLDLLAYSMLILTALTSMTLPAWLAGTAFLFVLYALLAGLGVLGLLLWRQPLLTGLEIWLARRAAGCENRWLGRGLAWGLRHLRLGLSSLDVLVARPALLRLLFCTGVSWSSAVFINWAAGRAVGVGLSVGQAMILLVALQVGISLPSLPINLGVFELTCVLVLQSYGIASPVGASYGILLHMIVYLPTMLLGALAWPLLPARSAGLNVPE